MPLSLREIIFCQLCLWLVESAPSLSKIEGLITPDESVQSLTNNIGNSIYTGIGEASSSDQTAGNDLVNKRKAGHRDISGTGDFSVTNTITSSKDTNENRFDQTSPTINEVKPTVKAMKAYKKQKKPTKGKLANKSKRNNPTLSENTLLDTFTTTTMSLVLDAKTPDPFFDSFDNFETTTPFGSMTTTPLITTTLPPLRPSNNGPPVTTFTPCSANIRADPKNRNVYRYLSGPWSGYDIQCPAGLEFREDRCRCDWPLMEAVENCSCCKSGVMKHEKHRNMFKRLINGQWIDEVCQSHTMVWDDKECKCVWDANKLGRGRNIVPVNKPYKYYPRYNERCVTLLNMTLDKELKDEDGKHITGRKIHSRRFKAIKGAVNKAMLFVYTPFELQSFKGNSLERNIYISFNFKPVVQNAKKVTLFSNGCKSYAALEQILPPSIEVNFFPHNETMEFIFKTESKSLNIYRKPRRDPYDWYRVRMYLQDKVLTIIVNNEVLYNSNGLNGKIISTNCNLMVGGSPFSSEQKYIGYMDEILIVKQCPYAKKNNLGPQAG